MSDTESETFNPRKRTGSQEEPEQPRKQTKSDVVRKRTGGEDWSDTDKKRIRKDDAQKLSKENSQLGIIYSISIYKEWGTKQIKIQKFSNQGKCYKTCFFISNWPKMLKISLFWEGLGPELRTEL